MALNIIERPAERLLEVHLTGKLSRGDYQHFVPEADAFLQKSGKIRVLVIMQDFHGWDMGGLLEDVKWDLRHSNHIERLAFVGEKRWQHGMSVVCKPFTKAQIRYFEFPDLAAAREWVGAPAEVVGAH